MIRVLMVDDEPLVRRGIVAGVDWAALGCEVVGEAQSGEEGLALARKLKPELIITDIRMPKMDGITMMNLLREEGCAAHCIVLTAHSDCEGHLSHVFKKQTGMTVTNYLTKTRIDAAMRMLTRDHVKVYEAAAAVGYKDVTYFSATFKKLTGLSPSEVG